MSNIRPRTGRPAIVSIGNFGKTHTDRTGEKRLAEFIRKNAALLGDLNAT